MSQVAGGMSHSWPGRGLLGKATAGLPAGDTPARLSVHAPLPAAVDGDPVPVPHFGVALPVAGFRQLAERLTGQVDFVIEPHLRFKGEAPAPQIYREAPGPLPARERTPSQHGTILQGPAARVDAAPHSPPAPCAQRRGAALLRPSLMRPARCACRPAGRAVDHVFLRPQRQRPRVQGQRGRAGRRCRVAGRRPVCSARMDALRAAVRRHHAACCCCMHG